MKGKYGFCCDSSACCSIRGLTGAADDYAAMWVTEVGCVYKA